MLEVEQGEAKAGGLPTVGSLLVGESQHWFTSVWRIQCWDYECLDYIYDIMYLGSVQCV